MDPHAVGPRTYMIIHYPERELIAPVPIIPFRIDGPERRDTAHEKGTDNSS